MRNNTYEMFRNTPIVLYPGKRSTCKQHVILKGKKFNKKFTRVMNKKIRIRT